MKESKRVSNEELWRKIDYQLGWAEAYTHKHTQLPIWCNWYEGQRRTEEVRGAQKADSEKS